MASVVPAIVTVIMLALGVGVTTASDEPLRLEASAPRQYEYRNAFGETEHYLVIPYSLQNRSSRPLRSKGNPLALVSQGLSLNDGFRPLVQTAFCRETGCSPETRSTPELQAMRIDPGRTIEGLAIFRLSETDPESLTLRIGSGPELQLRRTSGKRYVPLTPPSEPQADDRGATPALADATDDVRRQGHDGGDHDRPSWGIVKSSAPPSHISAR